MEALRWMVQATTSTMGNSKDVMAITAFDVGHENSVELDNASHASISW
jgi:hypothetical protein